MNVFKVLLFRGDTCAMCSCSHVSRWPLLCVFVGCVVVSVGYVVIRHRVLPAGILFTPLIYIYTCENKNR